MDYFNKFLKKSGAVPSSSSKETPHLSTPVKATAGDVTAVATPAPQETEAVSNDGPVEPPCAVVNSAKKCIERDANGHIPLWETKISKTVMPNKLVWAPLYLFGNQLFCARLCESDEINRDLHIRTPLLEGECVVEMIRAPRTKAMDTKLLIVYKNKVIPYYGKGSKVDEIDKTKWSEHHLKKLKTVLSEKWNKADAEFVYNEIVNASNNYLKEALLFEKAFEDLKERQRSPQYQAPKIVYEAIDEEGLALFGKHSTHERETLHVGDFVSFFSELNCDITVHTQIIGFSDDPQVPLVLDNGGVVHLHKRLRKFQSVPKEVNPLGYDPSTGHYRNLSEYDLDLPGTSQSIGKKNRRASTIAAPSAEMNQGSAKKARASSQRSHHSSTSSAVVSQDDSVTSLSVTATTDASCTGSLSQASGERDCSEPINASNALEKEPEKSEGSARKRQRTLSQGEDQTTVGLTRSARKSKNNASS